MKSLYKLVFILLSISCSMVVSCELLESDPGDTGPNITEGLKEALKVGTDTAVSRLNRTDGYLKDQLVKILLPDEMAEQITNFKAFEVNIFGLGTVTGQQIFESGLNIPGVVDIPSMANLENDLITGINRAAESAAQDAGPIFFDAITGITIADANAILFGADNAATEYLKENTFEALFSTYEPKVDNAINQVKIGDVSVGTLYNSFVTEYNGILNTSVPTGLLSSSSLANLAGLDVLAEPDLSAFATGKGLDGLFLKVEEEEGRIRENPLNRVTELLKDVFGLLD